MLLCTLNHRLIFGHKSKHLRGYTGYLGRYQLCLELLSSITDALGTNIPDLGPEST